MFVFTPRGKALAPSGELLIKGVDLGLRGCPHPRAGPSCWPPEEPHGALSGFREYPPIDLLSHRIVWVNLSNMCAQRGHFLIEFRVGQSRQEEVRAPVRGHSFPDDRMVLGNKASSDEGRADVIARRQIGIKHGAYFRKEVRNDDVVFTRGSPHAEVASGTQNPPALPRDGNRFGKVMIDLRHEYEIDAAVRGWKLVRPRPLEFDHPGRRFLPGLINHTFRWIEPNDPRAEFRR